MTDRDAIVRAITNLRAVYTAPKDVPVDRLVETWALVFDRGGMTDMELRQAANDYLGSDNRFWPRPGQLVKLARERRTAGAVRRAHGLQGDYDDWRRDGQHGPCPVCGSELDPAVRGGARHDDTRHTEAGVAYHGAQA